MLNKTICKKCIKKARVNWSVFDNVAWNELKVSCPNHIVREYYDVHYHDDENQMAVPIKDNAPEWCPFKFEQSVSSRMKKGWFDARD